MHIDDLVEDARDSEHLPQERRGELEDHSGCYPFREAGRRPMLTNAARDHKMAAYQPTNELKV